MVGKDHQPQVWNTAQEVTCGEQAGSLVPWWTCKMAVLELPVQKPHQLFSSLHKCHPCGNRCYRRQTPLHSLILIVRFFDFHPDPEQLLSMRAATMNLKNIRDEENRRGEFLLSDPCMKT